MASRTPSHKPREWSAGQNAAVGEEVVFRVGKIQYINMIPFFHQLQNFCTQGNHDFCGRKDVKIAYYEHDPAHINRALEANEIDLAPISSLAYLQHQKDYLILPDLAVGSRDFSGSVILFSKDRIEGLKNHSIAVSNQSLSSITLLKILMKFKYKFNNQFVLTDSNPEQMLASHKAALVIGDDALAYAPKEFVYKYDLSELWWNWTGKPFCFALWAVRKDFAAQYLQDVEWFTRCLQKNRDRNLQNIEQLLKDSMGLSFMDAKFSKLFGYLFNLHFGLDKSFQEGLELFYRLAYRGGFAPKPKTLEFFH